MTKEESVIRSILGIGKAGRRDIRILIYAVERAGKLMFEEKIPMEEIQIMKNIYEEAGRHFGKSGRAAARQIERLGVLCWDSMSREQRRKYIGREAEFPAPREMIFYLAYYCRFHKSYPEVVQESLEEFFGETEAPPIDRTRKV